MSDGYEIAEQRPDRGPQLFGDVFMNDSGYMVLAHLRFFCCAGDEQSPYNSDALAMARMVGRLEVFKEIMRFTQASPAQIDAGARRLVELRGTSVDG